jgi:hypothetical protein
LGLCFPQDLETPETRDSILKSLLSSLSVNPNPDGWGVYDSRNFEQV